MKYIRFALAAIAAGVGVLSADAATQRWEDKTTKTWTSGYTYITDEIELAGTVTINVESGARLYLNGAVKDADGCVGRIIKIGGGQLLFKVAEGGGDITSGPTNTFTGGIYVQVGHLQCGGSAASTGATEKTNPFGYGVNELDFMGTGNNKPSYDPKGNLANKVVMYGESSWTKPLLNRGGGTGVAEMELQGDSHYIAYANRPDGTSQNGKISFNKPILCQRPDGKKCNFYWTGGTAAYFHDRVICDTLDSVQRYTNGVKGVEAIIEPGTPGYNQVMHTHYPGMFGGFWFVNTQDSEIETIRVNQGMIGCSSQRALNGERLEFYGGHVTRTWLTAAYGTSWPIGKRIDTGYINLNAYTTTKGDFNQEIKWIKSDYRDDTEPHYEFLVSEGNAAILNILGEANVTAVSYFRFTNSVAIIQDAPANFTQVFSNRTHSINRTVNVKGGTLEFANCRFVQFYRYLVSGGGKIRFRDSDAPAFPSPLTLDNGTVELVGTGVAPALPSTVAITNGSIVISGYEPISNTVASISLSNNAKLNFPNGSVVTVNELVVDGERRRDGDYTDLGSGVTLKVRGAVFPTDKTALWVGKGLDDSVMTRANWEGDTVPSFDDGLKVTFAAGGDSARFLSDTTIGAIVMTNQDITAAAYTNFTISGNSENAADTKLTLYGSMVVDDSINLTLKNITIATPYGYDQGQAARYGDKTITIIAPSKQGTPLILDNAIIEKPMYFEGHRKETTTLFSTKPGTYNEFKGDTWKENDNWGQFSIAENSTLVFSGGHRDGYKNGAILAATATFIIRNKPWTSKSNGNSCLNLNGGHVIFECEDNYFGYANSDTFQDGCRLDANNANSRQHFDLRCNYAVKRSRFLFYHYSNRQIIFDCNSYTQQVTCLRSGSASTKVPAPYTSLDDDWVDNVRGTEGSMLIVDNEASYMHASTNVINFQGAVGLMKKGGGDLVINCSSNRFAAGLRNDCTSTGPLILKEGYFELGERVTWKNTQYVEISGGEFKVNENLALGREAVLNLTGGQISVPKGKTLWFSSVNINGEPVVDGDYAKGSVGNPFEGYMSPDCEGTIRVCQRGYMLIYR